MKKNILYIIIVFFPFLSLSQGNFGEKKNQNLYKFGYRFITTGNGVGQYYVVYAPDNNIKKVRSITKQEFIEQAAGLTSSKANENNENFFTKYNVIDSAKLMSNVIGSIGYGAPKKKDYKKDEIYKYKDDSTYYEYKKRTRFNNSVSFIAKETVNNLWKLRYAIYPFSTTSEDTLGWTGNRSNSYMPKPEQMEILEGYGLERINGFIYGEDFFRLLKDIRKPDWIEDYKNADKE